MTLLAKRTANVRYSKTKVATNSRTNREEQTVSLRFSLGIQDSSHFICTSEGCTLVAGQLGTQQVAVVDKDILQLEDSQLEDNQEVLVGSVQGTHQVVGMFHKEQLVEDNQEVVELPHNQLQQLHRLDHVHPSGSCVVSGHKHK